MKRHEMLQNLSDVGTLADTNFDDDPEVMGWFGWFIADGVLTIRFESEDHTKSHASWRLEPVSDRD